MFTQKEVKTLQDNILTLLIDCDNDRLLDIIPQLIDMEFIKSKSEFILLLEREEVQINEENLAVDDLCQVLFNFDVIKIGEKGKIKINK